MDLKEALIEGLKQFGPDGEPLIKQVEETTDRQKLFLMWQSLREGMLKEFYGKNNAPFQVQGQNGEVKIVQNIDEFLKE
jgi:hypothetical protein